MPSMVLSVLIALLTHSFGLVSPAGRHEQKTVPALGGLDARLDPASRVVRRAGAQIGSHLLIEETKLTAYDPAFSDKFGFSVSISGDTAVVGMPYDESHAGAAYVFVRMGTAWSEQAKLTQVNGEPGDHFGESVCIDGDTAVIGSMRDDTVGGVDAGSAHVFVRVGTSWSPQGTLEASGGKTGDQLGGAVSICGDLVLVGAYADNISGLKNAGSAYIFVRNSTTWIQQAKLKASDGAAFDLFGTSVSICGNTAVVGAPFHSLAPFGGTGAAYVYEQNGTNWVEQAKLTSGSIPAGWVEDFGMSVSILADTILVGSPYDDYGVKDAGAAHVFVRSGASWIRQQVLVASDGKKIDSFGISVCLTADKAVVGAPYDDDPLAGLDTGGAYVFARSGITWSEQAKLTASDGRSGDLFGVSTSISGDTCLVGSPLDMHGGLIDAGSAYAFRFASPLTNYCTAGTSASGCQVAIASMGTPSATAQLGFSLIATNVEGSQDGIFFFGTNGRNATPWGNGTSYQCVSPPVKRCGLIIGAGAPGTCEGAFSLDMNTLWSSTPVKNPGAGAVVQAQLWYLDPLTTSNQATSLSNAIEFVVGP